MSAIDIEALLAGEPPTSDEARRLHTAIAALRSGSGTAPDNLRARVRELRPAAPQRPAARPRTLLAAAALVAVAGVFGAAVLHGVFSGKGRTIETVQRAM